MKKHTGRICLMLYDSSSWPDVQYPNETLAQLREVITSLGIRVEELDIVGNSICLLDINSTRTVVFNLCNGIRGDYSLEYQVPRVLELLRVPFTGCSSRTLQLCGCRSSALHLAMKTGVAAPMTVPLTSFLEEKNLQGKFVVKHEYEHGFVHRMQTLGLDASNVSSLIRRLGANQVRNLRVEQFIYGEEVRILSVNCVNTVIRGYASITRNLATQRGYASPILDKNVAPETKRIVDSLDMVFDEPTIIAYDLLLDNQTTLIDVNANLGMHSEGFLSACLLSAGVSRRDLVGCLIDSALSHVGCLTPTGFKNVRRGAES